MRGEKFKVQPNCGKQAEIALTLLDPFFIFLLPLNPHRQSFLPYHHERKGAPRKYLVCRYAAHKLSLATRDGAHIFHLDANTRQDATQQMETAAQDNYVRSKSILLSFPVFPALFS